MPIKYSKNGFEVIPKVAILVKGTNKVELCFHATSHSVGDSFFQMAHFKYLGMHCQHGVILLFKLMHKQIFRKFSLTELCRFMLCYKNQVPYDNSM